MIFDNSLAIVMLSSLPIRTFEQFGPRSSPTKHQPDLDQDCLTLMIFTKEFFIKVNFEKISRQEKACKITHHANSKHIHSLVQILADRQKFSV